MPQPDPSTSGVPLASRHLFCPAQGLLCTGQLSRLGRQLPRKLFQLVTLLFHLGRDSVSVGQQGWEVREGHTRNTPSSQTHASLAPSGRPAVPLPVPPPPGSAVSPSTAWPCRHSRRQGTGSDSGPRGRAALPEAGTHLPEQLGVRVNEFTVLLLQLAVASLCGTGLP